jgi:DNA-binding transcriptional ArsR family regulator
MAIRFRLDPDPADAVGVALSPLCETVLSLHVLIKPKYHPVQHPWVRAMRTLSPALKREVRAFTPFYVDAIPDAFLPAAEGATFAEELTALEALPLETLAYELARPLFHYSHVAGGRTDLADPVVRERSLSFAGFYGADCAEVARQLLDEPELACARALTLLRDYWEAAFGEEWERIRPQLEEEAEEARTRVRQGRFWELAEELRPELRVDAAAGTLVRASPHEHEVVVSPSSPLLLVPSLYIFPHARVNCDGPWPLAVVYPAREVAREGRLRQAPEALVRGLQAVGDPTRLRALRLIAERPRSTEELAPLVGLTEAGLSKHLRRLAAAGLVVTRRDGYYVLYDLDRERLAELGPELLGFVGG